MAANIQDLDRSFEAVLRKFQDLQRKLKAALAPYKPSADSHTRILSRAEEFGAHAAMKRLGNFPDEFGVHLPADVRREVEPLLESLLEANQELDRLLADIEKLRAADPKRQPVYQFQGRKFEVDQKKGMMTYLDAPDKPVPLNLAVVHTKDQPDQGRQAPVRSKDREKGRER